MCDVHQSDSSFAEIMEGKARRREELMKTIREADPVVLAEAAERLREAMRKKDPSHGGVGWVRLPSASDLG